MLPERIAVLSIHTSPLDQPGTGDAGGMNVYIVETAKRIAQSGVQVDIFTRATTSALPPSVELAPGVTVQHITAGPFEGLLKNDLPSQLCAVTAGVMRAEASKPEGYYGLIHSHYWLSGQVGWLASERWKVPLVHTMHTMGRVKNLDLAQGDRPEPEMRIIGEQQVVDVAQGLIANTEVEAKQLIDFYSAKPDRIEVVNPGVDLQMFSPGPKSEARKELVCHSIPPSYYSLVEFNHSRLLIFCFGQPPNLSRCDLKSAAPFWWSSAVGLLVMALNTPNHSVNWRINSVSVI